MRPRLLFYSDCYIFGGSENVLVHLLKSAEIQARYDVHFAYARNRDYERGVRERLGGVPNKQAIAILSNDNLFYRLGARHILKLPFALLRRTGLYTLYNFVRLYFLVRVHRPDILHINNGGYPGARSCLVAVRAARAAGVKRVIFNVNNLAGEQVSPYIARNTDLFITASQAARAALIEKGAPPEKVRAIANAEDARPASGKRETSAAFEVVVVANLSERKGHRTLLEALLQLRQRSLHVTFVGEGETRPAIEAFIREHGLESKVALAGFRRDDYELIAGADLFVLPSLRDEDMPYVILSAMSLGKPIIASDVAGITEEIRDGIDGLIVPPGDATALAEAIAKLHDDPALRARLGASAKARHQELFTVDRAVAQYLAVYEALT